MGRHFEIENNIGLILIAVEGQELQGAWSPPTPTGPWTSHSHACTELCMTLTKLRGAMQIYTIIFIQAFCSDDKQF